MSAASTSGSALKALQAHGVPAALNLSWPGAALPPPTSAEALKILDAAAIAVVPEDLDRIIWLGQFWMADLPSSDPALLFQWADILAGRLPAHFNEHAPQAISRDDITVFLIALLFSKQDGACESFPVRACTEIQRRFWAQVLVEHSRKSGIANQRVRLFIYFYIFNSEDST